jgi:hypothetical protein
VSPSASAGRRNEQFALEHAAPVVDESDGDLVARVRETATWRETGEVAYERDVALRLTIDGVRVVRIVVEFGGA